MTKEELERQKWNDIFLEDCAVYDKKIAEEYTTLEEQIANLKEENIDLEKKLKQEQKINEEIKVRFVKCSYCTEEMKDKCLMFSENLCEGERCEELVDLVALVNQSELQNKYSELEKENKELQQKWLDESYEKAKLVGQLNKAKEMIKELYECLDKLYLSGLSDKQIAFIEQMQDKTEQFLKECE